VFSITYNTRGGSYCDGERLKKVCYIPPKFRQFLTGGKSQVDSTRTEKRKGEGDSKGKVLLRCCWEGCCFCCWGVAIVRGGYLCLVSKKKGCGEGYGVSVLSFLIARKGRNWSAKKKKVHPFKSTRQGEKKKGSCQLWWGGGFDAHPPPRKGIILPRLEKL